MVTKRSENEEIISGALKDYVKVRVDAPTVYQVSQPLELYLTGSQAYIPSFTRQEIEKNHGAPVLALLTKTDPESKRVFFYPAPDPKARAARKLRGGDSMSAAYFAFGVPLRCLKLKFPLSRRIIFPVNVLEVPDQGTVYWISFADFEKEPRNVNTPASVNAEQSRRIRAMTRQAEKQVAAASSDPGSTDQ